MARISVPGAEGLPRSVDVLIIGGGIAGCATAFYASEAGFDTLVIERRDP
jgi:glycine/D-amino acid oxidase-like deaminating enzyme